MHDLERERCTPRLDPRVAAWRSSSETGTVASGRSRPRASSVGVDRGRVSFSESWSPSSCAIALPAEGAFCSSCASASPAWLAPSCGRALAPPLCRLKRRMRTAPVAPGVEFGNHGISRREKLAPLGPRRTPATCAVALFSRTGRRVTWRARMRRAVDLLRASCGAVALQNIDKNFSQNTINIRKTQQKNKI
jgi:hypothetical protein